MIDMKYFMKEVSTLLSNRRQFRGGKKVMKKVKGQWVGVLCGVVLLGAFPFSSQAYVYAEISNQLKGIYTDDRATDFEEKDELMKDPLVQEESQKAIDKVQDKDKVNTVEEVKAEIERQQELGLEVYIIQHGDTLEVLAEAFEVDAKELAEINQLDMDKELEAGDILTYEELLEKEDEVTELTTDVARQEAKVIVGLPNVYNRPENPVVVETPVSENNKTTTEASVVTDLPVIEASQVDVPVVEETTMIAETTVVPVETTIAETTVPVVEVTTTTEKPTLAPETTVVPVETTIAETTIPVVEETTTTADTTVAPETTVAETTVPVVEETTVAPETTAAPVETTVAETTAPVVEDTTTTIETTVAPETTAAPVETTVAETTIPVVEDTTTTVETTVAPEVTTTTMAPEEITTTVETTVAPETTVVEETYTELDNNIRNYLNNYATSLSTEFTIMGANYSPELVFDRLNKILIENDYLHAIYKASNVAADALIYENGSPYSVTIRIDSELHHSLDEEQLINNFVDQQIQTLGLNDATKTTFDKVKLINDFITKQSAYVNYAAPEPGVTKVTTADGQPLNLYNGVSVHSPYVLTRDGYDHRGVCQAYAGLFQKFADKTGINAIYVTGEGTNNGKSEPHAWNKVEVDGQWYNLDVTWNDPTTGALSEPIVSGLEDSPAFFLVSDEHFTGHVVDPKETYRVPSSAPTDYLAPAPTVAAASVTEMTTTPADTTTTTPVDTTITTPIETMVAP